MRFITMLLICLLLYSTSHASNGVFEINSNCAEVGCFEGDDPGYPVEILTTGSFRLTGDLIKSSGATQPLILIDAAHVSLDLNGFSLIGLCVTEPPCSGTAGLDMGILIDSDGSFASIVNGSVRGMRNLGIFAFPGAEGIRLESLTLTENISFAAQIGDGSIAENIISHENQNGFLLRDGALLRNSTVFNNDNIGVTTSGTGIGFCSNVVMKDNPGGNDCQALSPNFCSPATDCD